MSLARWFWGGFLLVLLAGLMLALLAVVREGGQWASHQIQQSESLPSVWKPVIRLTLEGGESADLAPEVAAAVRLQGENWLIHRQGGVRQAMEAELDRVIDPVFDAALERVPDFADWYYSLGGEYLRLFHAVAGDLPAFLAERLEELVFRPAGTAASLDQALLQLDASLAGQIKDTAVRLQALLLQLLGHVREKSDGGEVRVQAHWAPLQGVSRGLQPFLALNDADLGRQGVAAASAVAAGALVFKKIGAATVAKTVEVLAAKQSAGMLAALASKLGLKALAKGGVVAGAGAGAAGGAGLCAGTLVGAPLAPGCALLGGIATGAATWLLVDTAVLEGDELLHRGELEQQMRAALQEQRDALKEKLSAHYGGMVERGFAALGGGLAVRSGED